MRKRGCRALHFHERGWKSQWAITLTAPSLTRPMLLNSSLALHERVVNFLCFTLGAFLVRPQAELQKSKEGSEALRQENLAISRQLVDVQSQVGECDALFRLCRAAQGCFCFEQLPCFPDLYLSRATFPHEVGSILSKGLVDPFRRACSEQVCPGPGSIVPCSQKIQELRAGLPRSRQHRAFVKK